MQTIRIEEPPRVPVGPPAWALWQLGFRPFYLAASVFAALSVALWGAQVTGVLGGAYLPGSIWHAHEMLFGFTQAVIVGFLFTAGQNWSGKATPKGGALQALVALWVLGRVLVLSPWAWAAAAVSVAFGLAAAVALARPLLAARSRRNYYFVALLVLMAGADGAVHLSQLKVLAMPDWLGVQIALDVVLFIMAAMGGRVIPMFTNNGVPGSNPRRHAGVEKLALGLVLALLVADALHLPGVILAAMTGAAAATHLARLVLWQPWAARKTALVWALHLAYAWIPMHLALRCLAAFGWIAPNLAIHALTVGAIGGLTLAMMTRTARGHTGRKLQADAWDRAMYVVVAAAAVVRVFVPIFAPSETNGALAISSVLWSTGFALYALHYWPVLTLARLDGRPG